MDISHAVDYLPIVYVYENTPFKTSCSLKVQDSPPLWVLTIAGREIVEARPRGTNADGDVDRESTAVDGLDSGALDIDAVNVSVVNTDLPTVGDSKPAPEDHDSKIEAQELAEKILFTLLQADNCTR